MFYLSLFTIIKKKTIPLPEKGAQLASWFVLIIVLKITKLSYASYKTVYIGKLESKHTGL